MKRLELSKKDFYNSSVVSKTIGFLNGHEGVLPAIRECLEINSPAPITYLFENFHIDANVTSIEKYQGILNCNLGVGLAFDGVRKGTTVRVTLVDGEFSYLVSLECGYVNPDSFEYKLANFILDKEPLSLSCESSINALSIDIEGKFGIRVDSAQYMTNKGEVYEGDWDLTKVTADHIDLERFVFYVSTKDGSLGLVLRPSYAGFEEELLSLAPNNELSNMQKVLVTEYNLLFLDRTEKVNPITELKKEACAIGDNGGRGGRSFKPVSPLLADINSLSKAQLLERAHHVNNVISESQAEMREILKRLAEI